MKIAAILLAAGWSSRMGTLKPLLNWFGEPLVKAQTEALIGAGAQQVVTVIGSAADRVKSVLPSRVGTAFNARFAEGKATSVRAGVNSLAPETETIVILAVDQPRPTSLIRYVIREHTKNGNVITAPCNSEGGGHPIIFDGSLKAELATVTDQTEGIRAVIRHHKAETVALYINTPLIRIDLNTPEDYEKAIKKYPQLVKDWENGQK